MKRYAFTMIELIFVIVILGILSAIAIPRLGSTINDAKITKGRSDIAAIRAAIVSERQSRLLQGQSNYINKLHNGNAGNFNTIFDSNGSSTLLQYGITTQNASDGHWDDTVAQNANNNWEYTFRVMNTNVKFEYNLTNGTFRCDRTAEGTAGTLCQNLTD